MDGKGRWIDNVFVERLWRSVKYEEVYLRAYANGGEARASLTSASRFTTNGAFTKPSTTPRPTRCISARSPPKHRRPPDDRP